MASDSFIQLPTRTTHDGTHCTSPNTDLVLSRRASQTEPRAVAPSVLSFPVTLRVVFQGSHSRFYLHHICLLASDTGVTVMRKLQEIYFQESSRILVLCGTYFFPYKPVVEIATLSTVSATFPVVRYQVDVTNVFRSITPIATPYIPGERLSLLQGNSRTNSQQPSNGQTFCP